MDSAAVTSDHPNRKDHMMTFRTAIATAATLTAAAASLPLLPASASATPAAPLPSVRDCAGKPTIRPTTIVLTCGDANLRLDGIRWHEWDAQEAVGYGTLRENTCRPNCARGTTVSKPVGITLHSPVGAAHQRHFTTATYGASGAWGNSFRDAALP
ncbi:hypothetical protein [Tsukamurella spumae]|uniref:Secreted protein n=1 Tax=Tsukamurella spumae TaxID=44753 RepID=A0A846X2S0_9ACTN|nr:hypothetical protein [Tsukamurella spumae]NKY19808.1 hypothetical protein [Tsukamurella spumae]